MIKILIASLAIFATSIKAQTVAVVPMAFDTVIDKGIYKSYYSKTYRLPVAVTYTLHKGGGDASRSNDNFINDISKLNVLTGRDYAGSGFDKGHLVPAEDFAFSDSLQDLTFRYYNCVPQLPALNRGKWKVLEGKARKQSQSSRICVVNLVTYGQKDASGMYLPTVCYKAIYNLYDNTRLWIFGYENNAQTKERIPTPEIIFICDLLFYSR